MEEAAEEEQQVMSEAHLGCPPAFAGPYISSFTFSVPPTLDKPDGINVDMNQVEASSSQKLCYDFNGETAASRRTGCSLLNDAPATGHHIEEHASSGAIMMDKDGDLVLCRRRNKDDKGFEVLDNCAANAHLNFGMLKLHENEVLVRELDWRESWPPPARKYDPSQPRVGKA